MPERYQDDGLSNAVASILPCLQGGSSLRLCSRLQGRGAVGKFLSFRYCGGTEGGVINVFHWRIRRKKGGERCGGGP